MHNEVFLLYIQSPPPYHCTSAKVQSNNITGETAVALFGGNRLSLRLKRRSQNVDGFHRRWSREMLLEGVEVPLHPPKRDGMGP